MEIVLLYSRFSRWTCNGSSE